MLVARHDDDDDDALGKPSSVKTFLSTNSEPLFFFSLKHKLSPQYQNLYYPV